MAHVRVINTNRKAITVKLDLTNTTLLEDLVDKGVISCVQQEHIKSHRECLRQASALLDALSKVSPEQFNQFLLALRGNDHGNLAEVIEGQMNMDPYILKKPCIVLATKNGNKDDPGLNAILEIMRNALLYIDGDVVDQIIHDTDLQSLDLDTVTCFINSIPDPVVLPRQTLKATSKKVSMSYIVMDTVKGCTMKATSQNEIETLKQYKSECMSPPNKVFFLGSTVEKEWDKHLEHDIESFNYIPAPLSFKVARLASRDQDCTKMQVLFDITGVQPGPNFENMLLALLKAATDIRTDLGLPVVVLVSNDIDDAVKNRLQPMVIVIVMSSKVEIISKFKENTIWVYIEDEGPLTWTRMQPVLYGMPQILPIRSTIHDILGDKSIQKRMAWSESKPIKDKVEETVLNLREAYENAYKLTCEFLCNPLVMKSREDFFKTCFSTNLAVLKAGIFEKTVDLGRPASTSWKSLDTVVNFLSSLIRYVGFAKEDAKDEKSINLKILKCLSEQLTDNTKLIAFSQGSICQLIYVRDEQALWHLKNMVLEGKASQAMLQVMILSNLFGDGSLKNCGIQMDLHSPNVFEVIASHQLMLEDMEMSQPLREATVEGNQEMVRRMLASGVDPDATGKDGKTTLHVACEKGQAEICLLLLEWKARVNTKDKQGKTPLHLVCVNGPAVICTMLLAHGAIVNSTDKDGKTALHVAAENFQADMCRILLNGKADVNVEDLQGKTPLHLVCINGPTVVCRMFLEFGAFVNSTDKNNRTPLHYSAEYGHALVSRLLLSKGASLDMKDKDGVTPCDFARRSKDPNTRLLFTEEDKKAEQIKLLQEAMQKGAPHVEEYHTLMQIWLSTRRDVLDKLKRIADEVDTYNRKANKAAVAGSSLGLAGAAVAVGSLFFPPLAVAAVPAMVVSAGGGVTTATSNVLDMRHRKRKAEEAEKEMKKDQDLSKEIEKTLKKIGSIADEYASRIPHMTREQIMAVIMLGEQTLDSGMELVKDIFKFLLSSDLLSAAALTAFAFVSALPVVSIPFAIFNLVTSLGQLTGNLDSASKELRDVITDLERGYREMNDMYEQLIKKLADIRQSLFPTSSKSVCI